jgi:phage-related protein
MAADNQIGLEAVFENADFQKGIAEYNKASSDAEANTDKSASFMSRAWDGMAVVGQAAFAAVAAGVGAMTTELYLAVDAAFDAEDAMARVNFIVDSVADRTGVTTEEVDALASSLSSVLPIDDEVIAQAAAMGLTFDGVNENNLQPLLSAAADLAAFTGKDLPGSMRELSLAISDPERAMRLLKDANITLSDSEMKTLKGFKDVGDTAGATTFLLDELKNKGITGLGEVMGDTAKGKFTIMQTAIGNLQEALGGGLLEAFKGVFDRITAFAQDPRVLTFLSDLGTRIGDVVENIVAKIPDVFASLEKAKNWLADNKPIIIGVLAAIGAALLAFAAVAIGAGIATALSFAPAIAALVAIGAVVALFVKAWQEDWGGIQGKVRDAWEQVRPVFEKLQTWMKITLPKVIKFYSDLWTKTLLPAMKTVVIWIVDNVLPVLVKLVLWLGDNVPKAIQEVSNFFRNTLLPALKTVGDWIENTLIPTLRDMRDWFQTHVVNGIKTLIDIIKGALIAALQNLSNIWNNVLLPAITAVYNFVNNNIMPILRALANLADAVLGLALRVLAGIWQNVLLPAIQAVWSFIQNVITAFNNVATTARGPLTTALEALAKLWGKVKDGIQVLWDKLEPFRAFLSGALLTAFSKIKQVISDVVTWIQNLADSINNLTLPDWLTPGSPTPFEIGLVGINDQLKKMASASLPAIRHQIEMLATVREVSGVSSAGASTSISNSQQSSRTYLFNPNFTIPGPSGFVETLQGL